MTAHQMKNFFVDGPKHGQDLPCRWNYAHLQILDTRDNSIYDLVGSSDHHHVYVYRRPIVEEKAMTAPQEQVLSYLQAQRWPICRELIEEKLRMKCSGHLTVLRALGAVRMTENGYWEAVHTKEEPA